MINRYAKIHLFLLCLLWLALIFSGAAMAKSKPAPQDLRWAYIMNIIHYITWPESKVDPVVNVCIVGRNPFSHVRENVNLNKRTGSIVVAKHYEEVPAVDVLSQCNVIYFSESITLAQLSFIFTQLKSLPVFTIGDHGAFMKLGGLLQFKKKGKKLRFGLNKTLLNTIDLKVHPSLLRLSE